MIQIATLVRYKHDGDIGIVTEIFMDSGVLEYRVKWSDGNYCSHIASELEVVA